jgi:hypothetical protein
MLANGHRQFFEFIILEGLARLARIALNRIDRNLCNAAIARNSSTAGDESIESFAESTTLRHE